MDSRSSSTTLRRPSFWLSTLMVCVVLAVALYFGQEAKLAFAFAAIAVGVLLTLRPDQGIYLMVILIPLEGLGRVVSDYSGLTWAKLALAGVFAGFVMRLLLRKDTISRDGGLMLLYAMFGVALAGTLFNGVAAAGYWELLALAGHILLLILIHQLLTTHQSVVRCMEALIVSSVPVVVFGLIEIIGGQGLPGIVARRFYASAQSGLLRITSTFYDPNALGRFLAVSLVLTVGLAMRSEYRRFRPLAALLVAGQVACLVWTFSRGGIISAIVGGILLVLLRSRRDSRLGRSLALAAVVVGVVVFGQDLLVALGDRFSAAQQLSVGVASRLDVYTLGLRAALEHPFIGYGPDSAAAAIGVFAGRPLAAHNLALEIVLSVGVIGLVTLLAFLVRTVSRALRRAPDGMDDDVGVLLAALGTVLANGLFLHGFGGNEIWIVLGLLAAIGKMDEANA